MMNQGVDLPTEALDSLVSRTYPSSAAPGITRLSGGSMDRWGNGTARDDQGGGSPGAKPHADDALSGALRATDARAMEISELSQRALSAKADLLAYVDELEDEIRGLRRRLSVNAPLEATDDTA